MDRLQFDNKENLKIMNVLIINHLSFWLNEGIGENTKFDEYIAKFFNVYLDHGHRRRERGWGALKKVKSCP